MNKVETAVRLLFKVKGNKSMDDGMRLRLARFAGSRLGPDGILRIVARRFRTQEANRKDAIKRLEDLLRKAYAAPKVRKPSRPPVSARERRLDQKRRVAESKKTRRKPDTYCFL